MGSWIYIGLKLRKSLSYNYRLEVIRVELAGKALSKRETAQRDSEA